MAGVMICPKGCRDLKPSRPTQRFVRRRETAEYLQRPIAAHSVQDANQASLLPASLQPFMGDNYCDAINNRAFCNYDGGDCCASTVKTKKVGRPVRRPLQPPLQVSPTYWPTITPGCWPTHCPGCVSTPLQVSPCSSAFYFSFFYSVVVGV